MGNASSPTKKGAAQLSDALFDCAAPVPPCPRAPGKGAVRPPYTPGTIGTPGKPGIVNV